MCCRSFSCFCCLPCLAVDNASERAEVGGHRISEAAESAAHSIKQSATKAGHIAKETLGMS